MHQEWRNIQLADEEESAFCIAAARLGQDPYSLGEPLADAILASAERLPIHWQDEFFAIADSHHLRDQTILIERARGIVRGVGDRFAAIADLRELTDKSDPLRVPWDQGYTVARKLRDRLGLDERPLKDDAALAGALGIPTLEGVALGDFAARKLFDAMVDTEEGSNPGFLTTKQRPKQIRFAFCRALFEYLTAPRFPSAFVTAASTERQKHNRAFAAEFLAPAAWLRDRIPPTSVTPDEVDEWADELGVSTRVVEHQIANHGLAQVVEF